MMSVVWSRILVFIDFCNKVIQANDAILDMKVTNIESLSAHLMALRDKLESRVYGLILYFAMVKIKTLVG